MYLEAAQAASAVARLLQRNAAPVADLAGALRADPPSVVITCARGSSAAAATYAKFIIERRLRIPVAAGSPSWASVYGVSPVLARSLALAISQSGASPDLLALFDALGASGATTVALVNDEGSPVGRRADWKLPLHAGDEGAVAATKSYITSVTAVLQLVAYWARDKDLHQELAELPRLLAASWDSDWSALVTGLADAQGLYVVGRGPGLGIAQEAALKLKETCGLHAEAFSAAEVRHGPLALLGRRFPLLVLRQEDESASSIDVLVAEVLQRGVPVFLAGGEADDAVSLRTPKSAADLQPLLQIQSLYRAAAELSLARGRNPDAPPHLKKVTRTI